jgi:hypothetical protein
MAQSISISKNGKGMRDLPKSVDAEKVGHDRDQYHIPSRGFRAEDREYPKPTSDEHPVPPVKGGIRRYQAPEGNSEGDQNFKPSKLTASLCP